MIPDYGKGGIMSKRNNKPTKNVKETNDKLQGLNSEVSTVDELLSEDIPEEVTEEVVETEEVGPEDISEETEEETVEETEETEETEEVEETKIKNYKAKVTANALRLRDAPSTDAVVMQVFPEGTEVTILTENDKDNLGEWEFVSVSMLDGGIKMEGYMMTKFLEVL